MRLQTTRRTHLFLHATAHFLVDGICAAVIFGKISVMKSGVSLGELILLYNLLAFATQGFVGILTDQLLPQLHRFHHLVSLSALSVSLALFLPAPALPRILLLGLGNSLFHVAGGTVTLVQSEGKAAPLGIFVAPGALGLAIGTAFPGVGSIMGMLLLITAALAYLLPMEWESPATANLSAPVSFEKRLFAGGMLLFCIFARSFAGTVVRFDWKDGPCLAILLAAFVLLGKFAGGFLADRFGCGKISAVSILLSGLCILFFQWNMPLSLAGQFLVNLSMPVTLYLLYRALPQNPGFSFGIAASALLPGFLFGQHASLSETPYRILIGGIFVLNLLLLIVAERLIKPKEGKT